MRTLLAGVGFVSALVAPMFAIAIAIALSVRYRAWEVIVIGLLLDVLWTPSVTSFAVPTATIASLALVWGLEPLRREFL